jgi:hypothetical protein
VTADISAVKRDASACRPANPRYTNSHLPFDPFENAARDLQTWRDAVLLRLSIVWAGTPEKSFAVSSHPDLPAVVEYIWSEEFPEIPADVVCQKVWCGLVITDILLLRQNFKESTQGIR